MENGMYTFTNKLRNFSVILMVVGFLGLTYGFLTSPDTVEEVTAMVADAHHGDAHGDGHAETDFSHENQHETASAHGDEHGENHHGEHLLHQLQNKPWAALYVAAFFF
ncbi:MAG: quinol:cytochrome C oxidoreductase, partial [Flavobacteriaceae bacterium]